MYRMETLVTEGDRLVLLVCEEGLGIKNFKIFHETKDCVDVGYTLEPVETETLITFIPNSYKRLWVTQTYYLLDLDKKKIYRVGRIGDHGRIDKKCKTRKIYFGIFSDTECYVEEKGSTRVFRADITDEKGLRPLFTDADWVNSEKMPGLMVAATFSPEETTVERVNHAIFLK